MNFWEVILEWVPHINLKMNEIRRLYISELIVMLDFKMCCSLYGNIHNCDNKMLHHIPIIYSGLSTMRIGLTFRANFPYNMHPIRMCDNLFKTSNYWRKDEGI